MATIDYSAKRATAERLITKFGDSGSFILKGISGGRDAFGNVTAVTDDVVIDGIITPLLSYDNAEIDGSMILSTDSYCYFHSDTAPEVGYTVTINSDEYRAESIERLDSIGGINVYVKVQLRK